MNIIQAARTLSLDLLSEVPKKDRCPGLQTDSKGLPYCSIQPLNDREIRDEQRLPCDTYSLQLWCLDSAHYQTCIFYEQHKASLVLGNP